MDRQKIMQYVKENGGAEVARLQKEFGVSYREAKDFVSELVTSGELVFRGGVQYDYVKKEQPKSEESDIRFDDFRTRIRRRSMEQSEEQEDDDISSLLDITDLFADTQEQRDADLRFKALEACIRRKSASLSMLQRGLNIGFNKASELLEWMQEKGYISPPVGKWHHRDVLITLEEFEAMVAAGTLDESDGEEQQARQIGSELYEFYYQRVSAPENLDPDSVPPSVITWLNDCAFADAVAQRIEDLVKANPKLGLQGAIKRAQICYEAVKDTDDVMKGEVYERIVYELEHTSQSTFAQLKKKLLDEQN